MIIILRFFLLFLKHLNMIIFLYFYILNNGQNLKNLKMLFKNAIT